MVDFDVKHGDTLEHRLDVKHGDTLELTLSPAMTKVSLQRQVRP